jgi:hypothetical protein
MNDSIAEQMSATEIDLITELNTGVVDLERRGQGCGCGRCEVTGKFFDVSVIYIPSLEAPTEAHCTIRTIDGDVIDTKTVPAVEGLGVFRHTQRYSPALVEYLHATN